MRCRVPWHDSLSCTAFQALPAEERSSAADVQVTTVNCAHGVYALLKSVTMALGLKLQQ